MKIVNCPKCGQPEYALVVHFSEAHGDTDVASCAWCEYESGEWDENFYKEIKEANK